MLGYSSATYVRRQPRPFDAMENEVVGPKRPPCSTAPVSETTWARQTALAFGSHVYATTKSWPSDATATAFPVFVAMRIDTESISRPRSSIRTPRMPELIWSYHAAKKMLPFDAIDGAVRTNGAG